VTVLATRRPNAPAVNVLAAYDRFRRSGSTDLAVAERLSHQAPESLRDLRDHVERPATPAA
jgi:hypothetical protein